MLESKALPASSGCREAAGATDFASLWQSQPGTGSTCQAPLRAQPSVRAASASSWPPNGTGQAKINTHLAGAATLRSLLREEAVSASAGSSLPRAGSSSRGRPRCSPPDGDRWGMARAAPPQRWRGLPPKAHCRALCHRQRGVVSSPLAGM